MTWVYLFAKNDRYPEPLEEIATLQMIGEDGGTPYLMLGARKDAPMKSSVPGDTVLLTTGENGKWVVHARSCVAEGGGLMASTPPSVLSLYGVQAPRHWKALTAVEVCPPTTPADAGFIRALPQRGQAYAIGSETARRSRRIVRVVPPAEVVAGSPKLGRADYLPTFSTGLFIGLDLTAGTWESELESGPKPFPVVALRLQNDGTLRVERVELFDRLSALVTAEWVFRADQLVIDGPCQTNGIALLSSPSRWDYSGRRTGLRSAERELSLRGIGLFWTSLATLQNFDGASRWIARSIRLFAMPELRAHPNCVESHPHAVFTILHRSIFDGPLRNKGSSIGRRQRLDLLRLFIPDLNERSLPSHDHVDAAAAALLGAIRSAGRAESVGDATGGYIWVPRVL